MSKVKSVTSSIQRCFKYLRHELQQYLVERVQSMQSFNTVTRVFSDNVNYTAYFTRKPISKHDMKRAKWD